MNTEILEYRNQARGPRNYIALGLVTAVISIGQQQGWGLMAVFLCGPMLGYLLVRLIENEAEGFRMSEAGLTYYAPGLEGEVDWNLLRAVTVIGDGAGGALCDLHLDDGGITRLPATAAFAPERLAQEFRLRGVPVWRTQAPQDQLATA